MLKFCGDIFETLMLSRCIVLPHWKGFPVITIVFVCLKDELKFCVVTDAAYLCWTQNIPLKEMLKHLDKHTSLTSRDLGSTCIFKDCVMCLLCQVCISQSRSETCGGRCCPRAPSSSTTLCSSRALEWYDNQTLLWNQNSILVFYFVFLPYKYGRNRKSW